MDLTLVVMASSGNTLFNSGSSTGLVSPSISPIRVNPSDADTWTLCIGGNACVYQYSDQAEP